MNAQSLPMTASAVMNTQPVVLKDSDTVAVAASHIMRRRYRNLQVVDGEGRHLGVFGIGCLLRLSLPRAVTLEQGLNSAPYVSDTLERMSSRLQAVAGDPVSMYMDTTVRVVHPDTLLMETLLILYQTRSSLAVVEQGSGRLLGVISYWEVLQKVAGGLC
jgi:CBS domain-containing protein